MKNTGYFISIKCRLSSIKIFNLPAYRFKSGSFLIGDEFYIWHHSFEYKLLISNRILVLMQKRKVGIELEFFITYFKKVMNLIYDDNGLFYLLK